MTSQGRKSDRPETDAEELERLREYERITRSRVCWDAQCHHQAEAMEALANSQREIDALLLRLGLAEEALRAIRIVLQIASY